MRKRLCRSFSKPRDIVALQHHLQDVIVDNLNAALMMVGEDGLAPLACPWNEPPGEDTSPDPGKEKAAPKGVQQLRPSRSEEHTSELQSLMRISSAVFCLKKK